MTHHDQTYSWIYDADFGRFQDDIPFYRTLAQRTGGPILELMCGTGRVLLPLATQGYQIVGVDIDPEMLAMAQAKATAAGLGNAVQLIQADLCAADLPCGFALAFIAINSFMHLLTVSDQLDALRAIHAALRPGALLALDLFNPHRTAAHLEGGRPTLTSVIQIEGQRLLKFVSLKTDVIAQTDHVTTIYEGFDADGHHIRHELAMTLRWSYRYELEHLLACAGFTLDGVFGSYDGSVYTDTSERLLVVAKR